jgi:hypothetical protein
MGKWWISEHAIWNQPITRAAVSSRQIVTYDSNPINLTSRASLIPFSQLPDSPQKQALERSPFNFSARATIPVHSWQPPTSALIVAHNRAASVFKQWFFAKRLFS